jgi:hypothetical protein
VSAPRATLITQYLGAAAVLRPVTEPALRAHAERHGHDVRIVGGPVGDRGKVLALRDALARHERAVWIDADALVLDDAPDLAAWLDDAWCVLVDDDRGLWQSWVLGLRRGSEADALLAACDTPELLDRDVLPRVLDRPHPGVRGLAFDTGTSTAAGVVHHGYNAGSYAVRARLLAARSRGVCGPRIARVVPSIG